MLISLIDLDKILSVERDLRIPFDLSFLTSVSNSMSTLLLRQCLPRDGTEIKIKEEDLSEQCPKEGKFSNSTDRLQCRISRLNFRP